MWESERTTQEVQHSVVMLRILTTDNLQEELAVDVIWVP